MDSKSIKAKANRHRMYATVVLGIVLSAMGVGIQMESSWRVLLFVAAGWLSDTVISQTVKASTWAVIAVQADVKEKANR